MIKKNNDLFCFFITRIWPNSTMCSKVDWLFLNLDKKANGGSLLIFFFFLHNISILICEDQNLYWYTFFKKFHVKGVM